MILKLYLNFFIFIIITLFSCSNQRLKPVIKKAYISELNDSVLVYPKVFYPNECTENTIATLSALTKKDDKILIIGTQTGAQSIVSAIKGASLVYSLDINPETIRNANENIKKFKLLDKIRLLKVTIDSDNIAYGNLEKRRQFDLIVFIEMCGRPPDEFNEQTFKHIKYKILKKTIQGLKDYLKPNGLFLLEHDPGSLLNTVIKETKIELKPLTRSKDGCVTFITLSP